MEMSEVLPAPLGPSTTLVLVPAQQKSIARRISLPSLLEPTPSNASTSVIDRAYRRMEW